MDCRCAAFYCELVRTLDFSVGSHETIMELTEKAIWDDPVDDVPFVDAFAGCVVKHERPCLPVDLLCCTGGRASIHAVTAATHDLPVRRTLELAASGGTGDRVPAEQKRAMSKAMQARDCAPRALQMLHSRIAVSFLDLHRRRHASSACCWQARS